MTSDTFVKATVGASSTSCPLCHPLCAMLPVNKTNNPSAVVTSKMTLLLNHNPHAGPYRKQICCRLHLRACKVMVLETTRLAYHWTGAFNQAEGGQEGVEGLSEASPGQPG